MKKKTFGKPFVIPHYKGRIHESYNTTDFIQAISDCQALLNDRSTEILLDSRNRIGAVTLPLSVQKKVDVVIKEFRTRGVNKLKSLFVPGKALRAWRGGMALAEKGIETPPPLAYLERRKMFFLKQSFFLTERINSVQEIRYLFLGLPREELREALVLLGQYLSSCHKKGVLHRDLSDGNILVKKEESGTFKFFLIDTNRVRIKKRIKPLKRIKNLIRLGVPSKLQRYFLDQYSGKGRVKGFHWFWYRFNKKVYTNYVELKKKLRLRQLAQKLKIQ